MCSILIPLFSALFAGFRSRLALQTEIIALRHQIVVLKRSTNRSKPRSWDRLFWIGLLRYWLQWRSALAIVKPETVIAWHRKEFRLFWTWKCRHGKSGRPGIPKVNGLHHRYERCAAWLTVFSSLSNGFSSGINMLICLLSPSFMPSFRYLCVGFRESWHLCRRQSIA